MTQHSSHNTSYSTAKKQAYLYPIIGSFLIPVFIGVFQPGYLKAVYFFLFFVIILAPFVVSFKMVHQWVNGDSILEAMKSNLHLIPPGYIYATDEKKRDLPLITLTLILLNTALFFTLDKSIVRAGVFLPYDDPSILQCLVSIVTSKFLHGSIDHLVGNMIILWVIGNSLEARTGPLGFAAIYALLMLPPSAFVALMVWIQSGQISKLLEFHSLGASGVISGLIGLFSVRCYFARLKICLPFFIPVLSIPVTVNGTLIIGLLFAADLAGSIKQLNHAGSHINYWAHVGGFISGFVLSYILKFHHRAAEESVQVTAKRYSTSVGRKKQGTRMYQDILERDPYNEEALRYFLKLKRFDEQSAEVYYVKLLTVLSARNMDDALELFEEYYPRYTKNLPGNVLTKIGIRLFKNYQTTKAATCFEFAGDKQGAWQPKALFQLGLVYEELEKPELAKAQFEKVIENDPGTLFAVEAEKKLKTLS